MSALFLVGGSKTYDGVTNIFATTSGGAASVAAVTSADDVTIDSLSGTTPTLTIAAVFSCKTLTINKSDGGVACDATHGITATGAVTLTTGTLNTNGQTCSWGSFVSANSNARTLTMGASAIAVTGSNIAAWDTSTSTNLTVTANTATITASGPIATMQGGSKNWNGASFAWTGSGVCTCNSIGTVANLTRTGTAGTSDTLRFFGNQTITGTCTLGGGSTQGVNRVLVQSGTVGTQTTLTAAAYVITGDVDFMDMNLAYSGAASWTNAGSAYIGDALGNTGAVTTNATVSATQTATGTVGFTWSTHGWTSRVPLPQDDVVINNAFSAAQTITADMPRLGRSIDFTGCTGTPTWHPVGNGIGITSLFGSFTAITALAFSVAVPLTFAARSPVTITGTSAQAFNQIVINGPGGTFTLAGTILLSGTGAVWTVTNGTIAGTGLIGITDTSATAKTFAGGGKTYGTLQFSATGAAGLTITGNNTFTNLDLECTTARTVTLPASGTQTINGVLTLRGAPGQTLSLVSSSPGTTTRLVVNGSEDQNGLVSLSGDVQLVLSDLLLPGLRFGFNG